MEKNSGVLAFCDGLKASSICGSRYSRTARGLPVHTTLRHVRKSVGRLNFPAVDGEDDCVTIICRTRIRRLNSASANVMKSGITVVRSPRDSHPATAVFNSEYVVTLIYRIQRRTGWTYWPIGNTHNRDRSLLFYRPTTRIHYPSAGREFDPWHKCYRVVQ